MLFSQNEEFSKAEPQIRWDFDNNSKIIVIIVFFYENICCNPSLELSHRGSFNECS